MSFETFKIVVTSRIDKHKADEAAKIERIRAEADAKARANVEAEMRAKEEEEARILREAGDSIVAKARAIDEAAAIESRRKSAQIAEQSKPFNGVPAKPVRPNDAEIIGVIMNAHNVSYGTACDWILAVAENFAASP
jgi:hypothetical protein